MTKYTRGQLEEIQAGVYSPLPVATTFNNTSGTVDLFTVESDGLLAILGDCIVDLVSSGGTIEVGVTGNTAALIPQTTATTLDVGERIDKAGVKAGTTAPDVTPFFPVRTGDVVRLTVGTSAITSGSVEWQLYFRSFDSSSGGSGTSASQVQGTSASGSAPTGNPVLVGGIYDETPTEVDDGDVSTLRTSSRGAAKTSGDYTVPKVLQNAVSATGNGTSLPVAGLSTVNLEVTGTFVGTVNFEAQTPAGTWMSINGKPVGGYTLVTSTTTTGVWTFHVGGYIAFRSRVTWTSGTSVTCTAIGSYTADHNSIQNVNNATALDEDIDSIATYDKAYTYTRLTADGVVSAVPVGFCGYYVEASTAGIISFYDNASAASGNAMLALSKAVTTNDVLLLENPIGMVNGLYFDLVSGTATVSILTRKVTSA